MAIFKTNLNPINNSAFNNYVNSLVGSDSNVGSRTLPYNTLLKAAGSDVGKSLLIKGTFSENSILKYGTTLVGDDELAECTGNIQLGDNTSVTTFAYNIKFNNLSHFGGGIQYCIVKGDYVYQDNSTWGIIATRISRNAFIYNSKEQMCPTGGYYNNTIYNFFNYSQFDSAYCIRKNAIYINSIDLYNYYSRSITAYYPIFKYCLFRKLTSWKWNGSIITINWNTNPLTSSAYSTETLLERVYNSLLYYANNMTSGTDKTYFQAILSSIDKMFFVDTNGQTNKVIDDTITPIFNRYNGTTPIDYSLRLDSNNVALTMSDIGSYVGAYKANLSDVLFGSIINVNTDGSDDTATPTLLLSQGNNQFSADETSLQIRNRIRSIVVAFPRGKQLLGGQSQLTSGLASKLYFGKNRPLIYSGGTQTIPVETFEVIPYNSLPTNNTTSDVNTISDRSTFPRFSVSFNGDTQMWYKSNGNPVLFNDLSTYSITTDVDLTEYGTWAVTSADAEDYNLQLIATANSLSKKNIPVNYVKLELNLNNKN